jgi:hypothetical protein
MTAADIWLTTAGGRGTSAHLCGSPGNPAIPDAARSRSVQQMVAFVGYVEVVEGNGV